VTPRALGRTVLELAGIAAAIVAAVIVVVWLSGTQRDGIAPISLPTGLGFALVYLRGWRVWPALLVTPALVLAAVPVEADVLLAASAAELATITAAIAICRRARLDPALHRRRDVVALVAAAMLCPLLSVGLRQALSGVVDWGTSPEDQGVLWWLRTAVGLLVVAPVVFTWSRPSRFAVASRAPETVAMWTAVAFAAVWSIWLWNRPERQLLPFEFFACPPAIWAAWRFGPRGAATAVAVAMLLGVTLFIDRTQVLRQMPPEVARLSLNAFLAFLAGTALLIAAVESEHQQTERALSGRASQQAAVAAIGRRAVEQPALDVLTAEAGDAIARVIGATVRLRVVPLAEAAPSPPDEGDPPGAGPPLVRLPISGSSGTLGWLTATGRREALDAGERQFLEAVCTLVGQAAERARLADEHRGLQDQLLQSQKMEALGRLAGGVAHDFNNLLTVILGYGHLLADTLPADHDAQASVREIVRSGERASDLTRQLLAFSRRQILAPRVVDLADTVRSSESMLRRVIGEDIEIQTVIGPGPLPVRVDPSQLVQVVLNLAVNARDAMPRGGRLRLEASESAGAAELTVTDTGVGMPPDVREHIFEPFFTTKAGGTGLGLPTVYGIVSQSGGTIEVDSAEGAGTCVRIRLPLVDAPPEPDAAVLSAARGGSEHLLVIEDEEGVRRLVESALAAAGYTVRTATSAEEALALLADPGVRVDLVLTDLVLPGMSGAEAREQIARLRPSARVLYMSGYTDDEVARRGVLAREIAFVQKPFTPDGLRRQVRESLDAPGTA
jgi:signal transduction histidine kinase